MQKYNLEMNYVLYLFQSALFLLDLTGFPQPSDDIHTMVLNDNIILILSYLHGSYLVCHDIIMVPCQKT